MSKYKVGDKATIEILGKNMTEYIVEDYTRKRIYFDTKSLDGISEPLSTYTEPLEAKIRRQAAEITRLLAKNKGLKEDFEKSKRVNLNMGRVAGQNEAWELVRKIFDMETNDIEDIFIKEDAWNLGTVLNNYTYKEAAAKVAEWEKAKEEIKVGDVLEYIYDNNVKCVAINLYPSNTAYLVFDDGTAGIHKLDAFKKTRRSMPIDSFLKQIGGEQNE